MKDKQYLIHAYNATCTDDGTGEIETYEAWLERQLLSRIAIIEEFPTYPLEFAKWLNFNYKCVPKQLEFYVPQNVNIYTFDSDYHYNKVIKEHGKTIEQLYNTYKQS